ncbi:acyl carrier protein [Saccharothrix isguenensis]
MTSTQNVDKEGLREIVADALDVPVASVTDDASFVDDLGVDSLLSLEVMVSIEREYGIKLAEEETASMGSFAEVWALVSAKAEALA